MSNWLTVGDLYLILTEEIAKGRMRRYVLVENATNEGPFHLHAGIAFEPSGDAVLFSAEEID